MPLFLDCLPCVLRGALEAARMTTDDKTLQAQIMAETIQVLSHYKAYGSAPELARAFQRIVKAHTGNQDPYAFVKERDMQTALRLLPAIQKRLQAKDDRLYWALKAAAIGNMLDSAVSLTPDMSRIDTEFEMPFAVCDIDRMLHTLKTAKTLLVIGDNTGETVFDGLLLKQFPNLRLTYAVRHAPVLNDATVKEAVASGLAAYAEIISTGCDVPGVLLCECSDEFLERFFGADIVIAKGQGNYETLSGSPRGIYHLLKVKCPVIARVMNVQLYDYVFQYNAGCDANA
ncbi:MAG TPA: ARMT1-like domain-containing protein [Candidatus Limiplasma sp.]|nr:ARMT1-like domain-containing protein [Candidatus Limiplasma sp.]HRX07574.1 ARMT1-like domain-containing protein [Candidatus Limiplasma sp.]